MSGLVINKIPDLLHKRLKSSAKKHRRSMVQEALYILEEHLNILPHDFPKPVQGKKNITDSIIYSAINEGRK